MGGSTKLWTSPLGHMRLRCRCRLPLLPLACTPPLPTSGPLLPQTFLLWLCTFHTNLVTSWLFLSLAILFWLLAGGVTYPAPHDQESRVVS